MAQEIRLTQGLVTLIDDEDFDWVSVFPWHARRISGKTYAGRNIHTPMGKRVISLHREIMHVTDPKIHIDHIDGDGLNNCRSNLRIATPAQNAANRGPTKGHQWKGVTFLGGGKNPWKAQLGSHGEDGKTVTHYLGVFETPEEAQKVYFEALREKFGDFASLVSKKGERK